MVGLGETQSPRKYITLIKKMYDNVVTSVRSSDGDTDDFPIKILNRTAPGVSFEPLSFCFGDG